MKKYLCFLLLVSFSALFADLKPVSSFNDPTIEVQNTILTSVNGKTISVVDVMKKMNTMMYQMYPDYYESMPARFQYYMANWKHVLDEMVNTELILADFTAKEQKISDGEIREEMEQRYGPNILLTLEDINLTYDEAWEMMKREMIVGKMTGYFVHAKAFQAVTPQQIRQAYRLYCENNPPVEEWHYQVISIRSDNNEKAKKTADKAYDLLQSKNSQPAVVEDNLKELEDQEDNISIHISKEYQMTNKNISSLHREVLEALQKQTYSKPQEQKSRSDGKIVHRIFYLKKHTVTETPSFDEMANNLKNDLLQKEVFEYSQKYVSKLRKAYGIAEKLDLDENFQPFKLK